MKLGLKTPILVMIAATSGLIVLLGYFFQIQALVDLRQILLDWAIILSAVALFVGVANLFRTHLGKFTTQQQGSGYSLVVLVAFGITLVLAGFFGPGSWISVWIFDYVLIPVETSLLALLAVILIYAGARLFARRLHPFTVIFALTAVIILAGMAALPVLEEYGLGEIRAWLTQVWALGGARGILLGVALGAVAAGLRIFMGADRPYGD